MALESFCYPPFIFNGLQDFMQFVSRFSSERLGVLLETGHLFQMGFDLDDAVLTFGSRLLDVHIHDAMLGGDVRRTTHLPIGSGNIDFAGLILALRKIEYDGWLTLEIDGDEREIIESKGRLESLIRETA
jgi:sugar phosphate isomerase/epimerase